MLLSESDREFYFPSVPLTGAALTGAIWRAQSTAETIAARQLDVVRHEETVMFSRGGQAQLKHVPIVQGKEFRITLLNGVDVLDYDLDHDEGLLTLYPNASFIPASRRGLRGPIGFDSSASDIALKAKVVYHAGFSSDDNDPRSRAVKMAVASILNYQVLVN
jgi:hypothetical protein